MSEKKKPEQDPLDENRAGVEDILGGLLGSNAGGMPQGGGNQAATGGGGDLAGMLGGLMGGGSGASGAGSSGDLMGMLGGLMGGGSGQQSSGGGDLMGMLGGLMGGGGGQQGSGSGDLMGMLGALLGGGSQQGSGVSANSPSILSALLPLVLGLLGGGGRAGQIDVDERTSGELRGMFGAAQSGELDASQVRASGVVQDVAAQTGASEDEVADTLAQLMQMLGGQR